MLRMCLWICTHVYVAVEKITTVSSERLIPHSYSLSKARLHESQTILGVTEDEFEL